MSNTIDQRVVEMRFDNSNFEKNVSTSMSTIDKLKKSLKFDGATKGLENVSKAAGKCDISPLASGVETVKAKFSALEVMAITALANITNSAVNYGKKIAKEFTIEPVMTGFKEYETQINAVQTILANTKSKGTTLDEVNQALDELNLYADKTIYNFTEMTNNIGKFTAAGVDLKTSVSAIQGIANLAAVSGSTSQQASTAMYQLSQALSSGTVKLMDWNSVVNAGMGGQVFQDALKKTSEELKTGAAAAIEAKGSFRESLTTGWLTAEVLTKTLNKLTTSGANEWVAEYTGLSKSAVEAALESAKAQYGEANAIDKASEALAEKSGKNKEEIRSVLDMAKSAEEAATKVKTFTQLMDTLKEAAQSGWTQTWELILGDFEEAKELFTELSDKFGGMLGESADNRNAILGGALTSKWDQFSKKLEETGVSAESFTDSLRNTFKEQGTDLDELIGKYGSLSKVMSKTEITIPLKDGGSKIIKPAELIVSTLKKISGVSDDAAKSTDKVNGSLENLEKVVNRVIRGDFGNGKDRVVALTKAGYDYATVQDLVNRTLEGEKINYDKLSNAQLKNLGYTDEQIKKIRELAKQAEETGTPLNELIEDMSKPSGRDLLIDSIRNSINAICQILGTAKKAWRETFFGNMSDDEIIKKKSDLIYSFIESIHKVTEKFEMSEETADKLKRTFKGLFAILDVIRIIAGGGLRIAMALLESVLDVFGLNVLDVTAYIGDAVVSFRDWLKENEAFKSGIKAAAEGIASFIKWAYESAKAVWEWIEAFTKTPQVQSSIQSFSNTCSEVFTNVKNWFGEGGKLFNEFIDRVSALDHISLDNIGDILKDFWENVVLKLFNFNPSKLYDKFKGIFGKLRSFVDETLKKVRGTINGFVYWVKDILPAALSIGLSIGILKGINTIADALKAFSAPAEAFANLIDSVSGIFDKFGTLLKAKAFDARANGILKLAFAVAVLAGSLALITMLPQDKLWSSVGALAGLAVVLVILSAAMVILGKAGNMAKLGVGLLAISGSLLVLSYCLKTLADVETEKAKENAILLGVIAAALLLSAKILSKSSAPLLKGSAAVLLFAISMRTMVGVLQTIDSFNINNIGKTVFGLIGVVLSLKILAKACGENVNLKSGFGMIGFVLSIYLFVGAIEKIADINSNKLINNLDSLLLVIGSFSLVMLATKLAGDNAAKAGVGLLAISGAIGLLGLSIKYIGSIDATALKNGLTAVKDLLKVFSVVITASLFAGKHAMQAGIMLLMMAGAITALTGVIWLLKGIDDTGLKRALTAIESLCTMFAVIIVATGLAKSCMSTLIVITVALGLLSGVLITLTCLDPSRVKTAAASLSAVVGVFALLLFAMKYIGTIDKNDLARKTAVLTSLTVVVAGLAAILIAMSHFQKAGDVNTTLANVGALSGLLISLAGACAVLSKASPFVKGAKTTAYSMLGVVLGIALIIGLMSQIPNMNNTLALASSLSVVLLALSASCVLLSQVGPLAAGAAKGALALMGVLGIVSAVILALGALLAWIPGISGYLDQMIIVLEKLGIAIGSFVGGLIGGLVGGAGAAIISMLPQMASDLSAFMLTLQPFLDGVKSIDESTLNAVNILAKTVVLLAGASLLNAIGNLFGCDFTSLGTSLASFGRSLKDYVEAVRGLTDDDIALIQSSAGAALALANLANAIPKEGGVAGWLFGEVDMVSFGTNITSFARSLMDYKEAVKGFESSDAEKIKATAEAAGYLTDLADNIPRSNGVAQWLFGETDFISFGQNIVSFAYSLLDYVSVVSGFKESDAAAIKSTADAARYLTDVANNIPSSGGVLGWLFGDNSISTFGTNIESFGKSLMAYANTVSTFDDTDVENIQRTKAGVEAMVSATKVIPTSGGVAAWFTGERDLTKFGSGMTSLAEGLSKYSYAASNINQGSIDKIKFSEKAVEALVNVSKKLPTDNNALTWFTGSRDISKFGTGMVSLAEGLNSYSDAASKLTDSKITKIQNSEKAVKAMVTVAEAIPSTGSAFEFFTGTKDLSKFGTSIVSFAGSLLSYSEKVSDISEDDVVAIENSAKAAKAMAEAAAVIPNTGGVVEFFTGNNDIDKFGPKLVTFANSLGMFIDKVVAMELPKDIDSLLQPVKDATTGMAEVASVLPNSGGVVGWWCGENDISTFGAQLSTFANGISDFLSKCNKISENYDKSNVDIVINATDDMVSLAEHIPTSGGVVDMIYGENDLDKFGARLSTFANGVKSFLTTCSSITSDDVKLMSNLENALEEIGDLAINEDLNNNLKSLSSDSFGKAKEGIESLLNLVRAMSGCDYSGVTSFVNTMKDLGTVSIDSFVESFENSSTKATDLGENLIDNVAKGISNNQNGVKDAVSKALYNALDNANIFLLSFINYGNKLINAISKGFSDNAKKFESVVKTSIKSAISDIKDEYDSFFSSGSYLVDGFASGISSRTWRAEAASAAMAEAAKDAAREALREHSPSKEFYDIGAYAGIALVNALDYYSYKVRDSGYNMGVSAKDGFSKAVSKISSMIENGMDTQPTIRPVLDLSDVEAGAKSIGGMFGINPSVGVLSNVRSINTMMNSRQNGANSDDLLSAINDLGSKLGKTSGDTYTINGITYDDGSNISSAVKSLVRATRIERRI